MMSEHRQLLETLVTARDYIRWTISRFRAAGLYFGHGTEGPLDEAAALVLWALHLPYDLPGGYLDGKLLPEERERVVTLVERRIAERIPLAYMTHEALFCGLSFYVDESVLVPRSPIAELIEQQFSPWLTSEPLAIADLGTGSGCIAIACALAFPEAQVDAVDISEAALEVCRRNIAAHEVGERVRAVQSDLFEGLAGRRYDLIVSNPPYVNRSEWSALPPEFHAEPRLGLESGTDGLDCARRILRDAAAHLAPDGLLVVEVGSSAMALEQAFPSLPFHWVEFSRGGDGVFVLTAAQLREQVAATH